MRVTDTHVYFWDDTIYSQWYRLSDKPLFYSNGMPFWTAEHFMMYHKAKVFNNSDIATECLKAHSPSHIKALGRSVKGFSDEIWDQHKMNVVYWGNLLKFTQNNDLLKDMLSQGQRTFVEASPYDKVWGVGLHYEDDLILDESNWQGENLLGVALNRVRDLWYK